MRHSSRAFAILICGFVFSFASTLCGQVIFQNNFDQHTQPIVYNDDVLDVDWNEPVWENGVDEGRVKIVTGAEAFGGSGASMSVFYPAGEHGTSGTGAQWRLELNGEYEEAYLSYRVKFKSGFDFVRGGKLPGLGGGDTPTGSDSANGVDGWTGRLMWRTEFQGTSGVPQQLTSNAISYAQYLTSGSNNDGAQEDRTFWVGANQSRSTLLSGVWYHLTQRVKMNDPGQPNGILQIWLDGELVHDQHDVLYRTVPDLKIDIMYFSTFFGGGSSWTTSKDETVYFDDFVVSIPQNASLKVPQDHATVQEAIDAAVPGDSVSVRGRRVENVVIEKPITLIGNGTNGRIVAADNSKPCVTINFANTRVLRLITRGGSHGIKVQPSRIGAKLDLITVREAVTGVEFGSNCHGSRIRESSIGINSGDGVVASNCDSLIVRDNFVFGNDGDGFRLSGINNLGLSFNTSRHNDGIGFDIDASDAFAAGNFTRFNGMFGFVVSGTGNRFADIETRNNGSDGFVLNANSNALLFNIRSRNNLGSGMLLQGGSDSNQLLGNSFENNTQSGIVIADAASNDVMLNSSSENVVHGYHFTPASSNNTASENQASGNSGQAYLDEGTGNQLNSNSG